MQLHEDNVIQYSVNSWGTLKAANRETREGECCYCFPLEDDRSTMLSPLMNSWSTWREKSHCFGVLGCAWDCSCDHKDSQAAVALVDTSSASTQSLVVQGSPPFLVRFFLFLVPDEDASFPPLLYVFMGVNFSSTSANTYAHVATKSTPL